MTWTYIDPNDTDRDQVRFLVGDTDSSDQLVTDEEIAWSLTNGGVYAAAAQIANAIASKFARKVTFAEGDLKVQLSDRVKHYSSLSKDLKRQSATRSVTPYAGGISVSDKESVKEDTDRVKPRFSRGQFNNPSEDEEDFLRS